MYSYEDFIRAVTLYIKLDKRTRATIRQLGYPTKNSLKSWHEEYERRLDLSSGYVRSNGSVHCGLLGVCIAATVWLSFLFANQCRTKRPTNHTGT